ncbi:MAG: aldehyde ferredoxin oxidoreductase [Desulfofustis sp. PB-SRB1]|jgi:aldehyde:ferredoxin oxidoreductase|nr:aldehyde ferredoxin oxidoreductase [Desulfofustis sp. PB-SRB1]
MADKIYRVDMTALKATIEDVPEEWIGIGGRGLTSTVVAKEVKPTCHPLGKYNKLVFAPGMLSGTSCANSGRFSAGAKSPLTKGIKEASAGGTACVSLVKLGVKAIIIEGMPEKEGYFGIHIDKAGITIKEETELVGKGNYESIKTLMARLGDKIGVIIIGPAGEMRLSAANISVRDPQGNIRSFGRGGLGAVMGAKKIKFISIDDTDAPGTDLVDKQKFMDAGKTFAKLLSSHPLAQGLKAYSTNIMINILNEAGALPTKDFRYGQYEEHEKVSGETMAEIIKSRNGKPSHACHRGCVIQCSQVFNDKDENYVTSGFEYETIWGLSAHSGISDMDINAQADRIMDDVGIDSIEGVQAIGLAVEAGLIEYGDAEGALRLLREIGEGTPLGRIIGSGAAQFGQIYGLTRVAATKGQAFAAYDPRSIKGLGITLATSPMGADHTAGYAVAQNILKLGTFVDPLKKDGQVDLSRQMQIITAWLDCTGLCEFVLLAMAEHMDVMVPNVVDMLNARHGSSLTMEDLNNIGVKVLKTEHEFNLAAGFNSAHDRLPEFFEEALPPHNTTWDFTEEEIDAFWNF